MNFDDTARFNGDKKPPPKKRSKWKILPWAWWPESQVDKVIEYFYPTVIFSGRPCLSCKRTEVGGRTKYCEACAYKRKLGANRRHKRMKIHSLSPSTPRPENEL